MQTLSFSAMLWILAGCVAVICEAAELPKEDANMQAAVIAGDDAETSVQAGYGGDDDEDECDKNVPAGWLPNKLGFAPYNAAMQ